MKTFNVAYILKDKEYYTTYTLPNIFILLNYLATIFGKDEEVTMIKITQSKVTLRSDVKV